MIHFRLADLMLEKGISNKSEFAREIDMHRWGLFKLIQNEPKQLETLTIEKLCRALDVLPNELIQILNDDGTPFVPRKMTKSRRRQRKVSLDKVVAKMSTDRKLAFVKVLLK